MTKLEQSVMEMAAPVAEAMGYELIDVEYINEHGRYCLALYIDRTDGQAVTTEDCEKVSRELDPRIDKMDISKEPYDFEVSSPGLDRSLKTKRDFERAKGQLVEIKFYKAVNGSKVAEGELVSGDDSTVTVKLKGGPATFDRSSVVHIKRVIIF